MVAGRGSPSTRDAASMSSTRWPTRTPILGALLVAVSRNDAELALTDRIELWIDGLAAAVDPFLDPVVAETLADRVERGPTPAGLATSTVTLDSGTVALGLRRVATPAEGVPA